MILLLFFASSQQVSVSPDESEQLCDDFLRLSNLTLARSQALFAVAEAHVQDLSTNGPTMASCTAKSWSDAKPDVWKSCCVEDGPSLRESEVVCVETKPKQLTQSWGSAAYNARALELVATKATTLAVAADTLMQLPNAKFLYGSEGAYSDYKWQAIGCAFAVPIASIWFGEMIDNLDPSYVRGGALPIVAKTEPPASFFDSTTNIAIVAGAAAGYLVIVSTILACVLIKKKPPQRVGSGLSSSAQFDLGYDVSRDLTTPPVIGINEDDRMMSAVQGPLSSIGFDVGGGGGGGIGDNSGRIAVSQYVAAPVSGQPLSRASEHNTKSQYGTLAVHPIQHSDGALAFASPLSSDDAPTERQAVSQYAEFVPDRESKKQTYVIAPKDATSNDLF